jgi:phage tail sheath gpL-like
MKVVLSLTAVMLVFAAVGTGAASLFNATQAHVHVQSLMTHSLPEPAALVALGAAFVLLAKQVRRKPCEPINR